MPDIPVASLDLRLQRQVESARSAFTRSRHADTVAQCALILQEAPGCLTVRKLQR